MAIFKLFAPGHDLFDLAPGRPLAEVMRFHSGQSIALKNWDGSATILTGSGLAWDGEAAEFTAGTIQSIRHSAGGKVLDVVTGLNLPAREVQAALEAPAKPAEALRLLVFAGNDAIDASQRRAGAPVDDFLVGYGGDDSIAGGSGSDEIYGLAGRDSIDGNAGADFLNGGLDDDRLRGMTGNDRLTGDGGADTLSGGLGTDYLFGGAGNDLYLGDSGIDTAVYTRSFADLVAHGQGDDLLVIEPNGHDTLRGMERVATDEGVFAWTPGTETFTKLSSTPGALLLNPGTARYGTQGNDRLVLRPDGKNIAMARDGNDVIIGSGDYDLLIGGDGNDRISGDNAANQAGGDRLYGDAGNDRLGGAGGNDLLYGGAGRDRLTGGSGNDTMTGGDGGDIFIFGPDAGAAGGQPWGADVINDFNLRGDRLQLNLEGGVAPAPELERVAAGWLVTIDGHGSILLKGLDSPALTLPDLLA